MAPFVYALVDPAEPMHVRYVGMARRNAMRPYVHSLIARRKNHSSYLYNWIRKIQSEGREPNVVVLEQLSEDVSLQMLGFVERCYIDSLRRIGHRLTNVAEGGQGGNTLCGEARSAAMQKMWNERPELREGARQRAQSLVAQGKIGFKKGEGGWSGRQHSEEAKRKMRESQKARWTTEAREAASRTALANFAGDVERSRKIKEARAKQIISHSEETRRKLSAAWTDERRASNPNKGRIRPQEERDRISASRKGWKPSDKTLANMKVAAQRREAAKRAGQVDRKKNGASE